MEVVYSETITSIANDIDSLWKDKDAFTSVKSCGNISIEDANLCSYQRFMLSSRMGASDENISNDKRHNRGLGTDASSMPLIDRLAKSASIWTLPDLSRAYADKILHQFQPGIFIVRMTTDKKTMVLSYRMQEKAQHVLIKVDLKKGFFMDGSQYVFRNVNHMIAHYMKHPIQNPDLCLKLPRALMEAYDAVHFQFFENMKIDFWKTLMAKKSIDEIWPKSISDEKVTKSTIEPDTDNAPLLPPRRYLAGEVNIVQGLADIVEEPCTYQEIKKVPQRHSDIGIEVQNSIQSQLTSLIEPLSLPLPKDAEKVTTLHNEEYSSIWKCKSEGIYESKLDFNNTSGPNLSMVTPTTQSAINAMPFTEMPDFNSLSMDSRRDSSERNYSSLIKTPTSQSATNNMPNSKLPDFTSLPKDSRRDSSEQNYSSLRKTLTPQTVINNVPFSEIKNENRKEAVDVRFTIPNIIETYYPQLIYNTNPDNNPVMESLRSFRGKNMQQIGEEVPTQYNGQYAIPWDIKNAWISKLVDASCSQVDLTNDLLLSASINDFIYKDAQECLEISESITDNTYSDRRNSKGNGRIMSATSDNGPDFGEEENRLQTEFLGAIESVMFSPSSNQEMNWSNKSHYGQSIRNFIMGICSGSGNSEISKSIRLFIRCTLDRTDLSPYTTMRLIRQYMSGLKNLITKNQHVFSLDRVITEEIAKTPKNVFINLDSIIESVLTRSVVKPLRIHLYRLLVLEHYKNNSLRQIADGVEMSKCISPETLGLKENAKSIIDSKMQLIRQKFKEISKQYSPENKIKYMISIVDIVFNMIKLIYPEAEASQGQHDIKSKNILPLFVYIFSQCKLDAVSTQCEVEYVEGLIWSSKLVNGEPGFFLLNLMSALEAIKVLARPKLNPNDVIDVADPSNPNHCSLSQAAVGSVNVIIVDEKINRLVTKSIPVRSTVTVRSLCNTISHRLGIFNPKDYNLFSYTGLTETLLLDHESPLIIKIAHQQKTGENINFLFKRKNANFILPGDLKSM